MSTQRWGSVFTALAVLSLSGVEALAQNARTNLPPECRAATPEPWHVWDETAVAVTAAATPAARANIAQGKKATVTLAPAQTVRMAVTVPVSDPPPDAHAGMLSFHVPEDGTYWVSVSTGLWLDVVQGTEVLLQLDERPGPRCSGINKSPQYRLKAGDARIQLSDNPGARVDVLVVKQR